MLGLQGDARDLRKTQKSFTQLPNHAALSETICLNGAGKSPSSVPRASHWHAGCQYTIHPQFRPTRPMRAVRAGVRAHEGERDDPYPPLHGTEEIRRRPKAPLGVVQCAAGVRSKRDPRRHQPRRRGQKPRGSIRRGTGLGVKATAPICEYV